MSELGKVIRHKNPIVIRNRILDHGLLIDACDIKGDIRIINCKVDGHVKVVADIVFKDLIIDSTLVEGETKMLGTIYKGDKND